MDRGSDCEVRLGPAKLDIQIKSDWLLICLTFVAESPGSYLGLILDEKLSLQGHINKLNKKLVINTRIFAR